MAEQTRMRPGSKAWLAEATALALANAPRVGACNDCKQPCIAGFCCGYCGSGNGATDPETGERLR